MASFSDQVNAAQTDYLNFKTGQAKNLADKIAVDNLSSQIQKFNQTTEDMSTAQAGQTRLSGQFMLSNPGEKEATVYFPFKFAGKPLLSFGAEIPTGDKPTPGNFPTVSIIIGGWLTQDNPPYTQLFYGAKFLMVTTGPPQQRLYIHWHLDGIAYGGDMNDLQVAPFLRQQVI